MFDLDTLVLCFCLVPWNHRDKCRHSLAVAAASQPMCWLQGPAHIHMFPVCLAQQDTGQLHALLIIPTALTLQGHQPNSIFQHTLVNIMLSVAVEMWYNGSGRQTVQSASCHCLLLRLKPESTQLINRLIVYKTTNGLLSHCAFEPHRAKNFTASINIKTLQLADNGLHLHRVRT